MESSDQLSFRQKIFNGTINALKRNMDDFIGVDLSGFTEIETDGIIELAEGLEKNTKVEALELHGVNKVSKEGWDRLFISLPIQLTMLDLSSCDLGVNGAFNLLVKHLPKLIHLEELDLNSNELSSKHDVHDFGISLTKLHKLKELLLHNNKFGDNDALIIVNSISLLKNFEKLWIQNNLISNESRDKIKQTINSNICIEFGNK